MSIFDNLLGKIGYTRNIDGSHTYTTTKLSPLFGGTDKLTFALANPVLSAVINIRANCLSKVRFYVLEKDGTKNYEHKALDLIKSPNPFQSQEDFLKQYEWLRCTYGWVFQKPFGGIGAEPTAIYNLNPSKIEFPSNMGDSMLWEDSEVNEYLQRTFKYQDVVLNKPIAFSDIIPFFDISNGLKDTETSNFTSPSRIDGIIKQVSNINLASEAENSVIQTNGQRIVQTASSTSGANQFANNNVPLNEKDRKDISSKFDNKFLMRSGYSRTLTPDKRLDYIDLSIKLKDLGLHESINSNSSLITQAFAVPNEIYQSYKEGSTFENQAQAEVKFYQNAMQPVADDLASSYTSKFGNGNTFGASFEHLPMMQDVEDKKTDKVAKISKAFKDLNQAGMTTEESIAIMQGLGVNIEITK